MKRIIKVAASIFFILSLSTASLAEHESNTEKTPLKPGLYWQQMPIVCGNFESVNQYLEMGQFEVNSISVGRSNAKSEGQPVYIVTYFLNHTKTESIVTISVPTDPEVCMLFRSFDLRFMEPSKDTKVEPEKHKEEKPLLQKQWGLPGELNKGLPTNYMLIEME